MKRASLLPLLLLIFLSVSMPALRPLPEKIRQHALRQLSLWLEQGRQDAITLLEQARQKAMTLKEDTVLAASLKAASHMASYRRTHGTLPLQTRESLKGLMRALRTHFLKNYLLFYDLLLVNPRGEVVLSIRQEGDLGLRLLDPPWNQTPLGGALKPGRTLRMVDFQAYPPTGEASAFFVQNLDREGKNQGWLILQLTVNHLNQTLTAPGSRGQTGELLLVNRNRFLLTESRFEAAGSILKQQLPRHNIEQKFQERSGWREVVDYRGQEVLSAFEVLPFKGLNWLLIAKQDQTEILTQHLANHPQKEVLLQKLWDRLPPPQAACPLSDGRGTDSPEEVLVHMDHWKRTRSRSRLRTPGVSTCTAVSMHLPGRFTCLAHISPLDHLYGNDRYRILGGMIRKMSDLEMIPREKREVLFTVASPNPAVFTPITLHLLSEGFFLSQIRFVSWPRASSVDVTIHHPQGAVDLLWRTPGGHSLLSRGDQQPPLDHWLREIL